MKVGGTSLLLLHNSSLMQILNAVYPEHNWIPWEFTRVPAKYWEDVKNQRKFMDWAGKALGIKETNDWHNVVNQVKFLVHLEIYSFQGLHKSWRNYSVEFA